MARQVNKAVDNPIGCGSHSCWFGPRKGQATDGKCACFDFNHLGSRVTPKDRVNIRKLCKVLRAYTDIIDSFQNISPAIEESPEVEEALINLGTITRDLRRLFREDWYF